MSIRYNPEKANIDDTTSRAELLARIHDDVHCLDRAFRAHVEAFVETNGTLCPPSPGAFPVAHLMP